MCQILCLTSHDPAKRDEIITNAWKLMSVTQKDGYGACWFSPNGEIGFHKRRNPRLIPEKEPVSVPFVKSKTTPVVTFEESNDIPSDGGFLIIHGRAATGIINLANTHPMVDGNHAMIHNGVVKSTKYKNLLHGCTCDTELLFRAFIEGGIDGVEKYIDGWYAFMHLEYVPPTDEEILATPDGQVATGKKILHVAKDSRANLFCGVKEDGTFIIATTEPLIESLGTRSAGELENYMLLVFTGKSDYTMKKWTPVPYTNKYREPVSTPITPPYKHSYYGAGRDENYYRTGMEDIWDKEPEERAQILADKAKEKGITHTFPDNPSSRAQAQKDYEEAEKAEIERLEQEAINI